MTFFIKYILWYIFWKINKISFLLGTAFRYKTENLNLSQPPRSKIKQTKNFVKWENWIPQQFCSSWLQTGLIGLFAWMLPHLIKAISRWRPRKSWPCQTQTFSPLSNTMLSEAAFKTRYAKKKNFRQSRLCYFNDQFQELLYDSLSFFVHRC